MSVCRTLFPTPGHVSAFGTVRAAVSLTLLSFVTAAFSPGPAAAQQKLPTVGVFTDGAGKTHPWNVSAGHTLVWEGKPYLPVGGAFAARYLAEGQTDENWKKDTEALQMLKSKGMTDLILDPSVSAAEVPPAAWQRMVDFLEANEFHYGIAFGAGITNPLTGYVVKPTKYRLEELRENEGATWRVADADTARYMFVDAQDGLQVIKEGQSRVRDGEISVSPQERLGSGVVGILYPHKSLKPNRTGSLPDLWAGFDLYRDRLLATFSGVKFGPGLRFFIDPLTHSLSLTGDETEYIVPDSPAFRLEWEAWLKQPRHYASVDVLLNAWGIVDRESIKTFTQAARLVPMAVDNRGLPFMLDPDSGKRYEARSNFVQFWNDLRECRNDSINYFMNATADFLKREVANVPVLYTRTHHHRIFTNQERGGGFDGLGIAAYGRGSSLTTSGADSVFSQAEDSSRPLWCLVTETQDTSSPIKPTLGYESKQALFYDLDWLRTSGAKGFFVNSFQALPETVYRNFSLVNAPEQIGWLKEYNDKVSRGVLADTRTDTLLYPEAAAGYVRPGPIGNSTVVWRPSLAEGKALKFGSSYAGYTIKMPEGEQTVLWSLRGPRLTHLLVGDPRKVEITNVDGVPIQTGKPDLKKKMIPVMLDENPVIIRNNESEVFPSEVAEDTLMLLKGLVAQAEAAKLGEAFSYRLRLDHAMNNYKLRDNRLAYAIAGEAVAGIVTILQPYTWVEAERAENHTFTEVTNNKTASGEAYLNLNAEGRPGNSGYGAEYKFTVPVDEEYTVWIACSPPGPQTSPFAWIIDTGQGHLSSESRIVGAPYLNNQFVWMNLGRVHLQKGPHTLTLRVTDPLAGTTRYAFAADSLLVTRSVFTPNGTARPNLLGSLDTPAQVKEGLSGLRTIPKDGKTDKNAKKGKDKK